MKNVGFAALFFYWMEMFKKTDMERMPWLAALGVFALISLFLYSTENPDFLTILMPTYATEALLFIGLGLELAGQAKTGDKEFRHTMISGMSIVWLLNQIFLWTNFRHVWMGAICWVLAVIQVFFAYQFFTGEEIFKLDVRFTLDTALTILAIFAFMKIALNAITPGFSTIHLNMVLWGLAVLLVCLGHLLPRLGYKDEAIKYLSPAGTLIGACVAFTIQAAGLTLLTILI